MPMIVGQDYTPPKLGVARALALAEALDSAAPPAPNALVARKLDRLRVAASVLSGAWKQTQLADRVDSRPADVRLDNAWGAVEGRLSAYARLDPDLYVEAARAEVLHRMLFPDGLSFVQLPFDKEWAESQKRLEQIDEQGLAVELVTLTGEPFVGELRAAHAAYGEALGITTASDAIDPPDLRVPLRALEVAIRGYADKMIGTVDDDDEAAVAEVRAALAPIEVARARARRNVRTPDTISGADGTDGACDGPADDPAPTDDPASSSSSSPSSSPDPAPTAA